jgi:hypothetical protein
MSGKTSFQGRQFSGKTRFQGVHRPWAQTNVEKDKQILQDLITCGEKLDEEAHKAFNKKPRSNIQEEQANIIEEVQNIVQKDKMNKTVCISITIIAIIMTIVIVYFTTSLSSNILDSSTHSMIEWELLAMKKRYTQNSFKIHF